LTPNPDVAYHTQSFLACFEAETNNMLTIPLASIDGQPSRISATTTLAAIQPEGAEPLPADTVTVTGVLSEVGGDYLFQGQISGAFTHPCDRCLGPAETPFSVEAVWNFELDPAAAFQEAGVEFDEEVDLEDTALCRVVENDEIRLGPHVWEEVALAAPVKYLCREDCKGLCPRCGANLNAGPCACPPDGPEATQSESGLAGLAKLYPDLAPRKKEE